MKYRLSFPSSFSSKFQKLFLSVIALHLLHRESTKPLSRLPLFINQHGWIIRDFFECHHTAAIRRSKASLMFSLNWSVREFFCSVLLWQSCVGNKVTSIYGPLFLARVRKYFRYVSRPMSLYIEIRYAKSSHKNFTLHLVQRGFTGTTHFDVIGDPKNTWWSFFLSLEKVSFKRATGHLQVDKWHLIENLVEPTQGY